MEFLGLDGFDGDFTVAPRKQRPLLCPLKTIELDCLDGVETSIDAEEQGSQDHLGAEWHSLQNEVHHLSKLFVGGHFIQILTESSAAKSIFAPLANDDKEDATGCIATLSELSSIEYVLSRRCVKYIISNSEGDAYYADEPGSSDTPVHFRAYMVVLVAASLLQLYAQANITGPELNPNELKDLYPLPYARSLMTADDVESSIPRDVHTEKRGKVGIKQWGYEGKYNTIDDAIESSEADLKKAESITDEVGSVTSLETTGLAKVQSAAQWARRSPIDVMSITSLCIDNEEFYELAEYPHFLATARAVMNAVSRKPELPDVVSMDGLESTSAAANADDEDDFDFGALADAMYDEIGGGGDDPVSYYNEDKAKLDSRLEKLREVTDSMLSVQWWSGRGIVLHQRSLTSREASSSLFNMALEYFRRVGKVLCPEYTPAWGHRDVFLRRFVASELAASGATNRAADEDDDDNVRNAVGDPFGQNDADAALTPLPDDNDRVPRPIVARLLLEWGMAQHVFNMVSSAKTAFFLAKRESGLQTNLTGALSKKTKFQTFNIAQLVLRAQSTGDQAKLAIEQALVAESLGNAEGKFSANALRELGLLEKKLPTISEADEEDDDDGANEQEKEAGNSTNTAASGAAGDTASSNAEDADGIPDLVPESEVDALLAANHASGTADASESSEEAKEVDSEAEEDAMIDTIMTAQAPVLGGVVDVSLSALDPTSHILEKPVFKDEQKLTPEEEKKEEEEKERLFYGKGWGRAMQESINQRIEEHKKTDPEYAKRMAEAEAESAKRVEVNDGPLSLLDQCLVLALCLDIQNHNPADGLTQEEMKPYVERALDTPLNWMIHSTGLMVRSWLEFESFRTAERAVLQLQALVDQHTTRMSAMQPTMESIEKAAPAAIRLQYVHCIPFPTRWNLQREAADRYKKLGAIRQALVLYEELFLWEDAISCYTVLDRVKKAESLVLQRLNVASSPRLWCILGELRDKDEYFIKAWEESNGRYARAQLTLGRRYMQRGQFAEAMIALRKGLALAPGAVKDWYLLGVITMREGLWNEALNAFSRVVQFDPTRADAWANMGSIHLRMKNWDRGEAALEQAIKADRRDWRIWSNFLISCCKTLNFTRAIHACNTLIELYTTRTSGREGDEGGIGVDVTALTIMVRTVLNSCKEERQLAQRQSEGTSSSQAEQQNGEEGKQGETDWTLPTQISTDLQDVEVAQEEEENGDVATRRFVDIAGQPAAVHFEAITKLMKRITNAISNEPKLWALAADIAVQQGDRRELLQCRLRQSRALQKADWDKAESVITEIAQVTKLVVQAYKLQQGNPIPHALAARVHVSTILNNIKSTGKIDHDFPAVVELEKLFEEAKAYEAEVNNS